MWTAAAGLRWIGGFWRGEQFFQELGSGFWVCTKNQRGGGLLYRRLLGREGWIEIAFGGSSLKEFWG